MTPPVPLPPHLAAIHRELGVPANYAATHRLALQPEAVESTLTDIGPNPDGRPVLLIAAAATAWGDLRDAARSMTITLLPVSGFRSISRQRQIILGKLAAGRAIEDILRLIAAPGFSEHHSGRALDIGCPGHLLLEEDFAETPAFAWLQIHAAGFGFRLSYPRGNPHGIAYEPWHWYYHLGVSS